MGMEEVDNILEAIENHMRREILKRLAEGRQYALQIAKELRTSQQAVIKHLSVLQEKNIIKFAGEERSERGAPRKIYEVSKSFSLFIDIGPRIFNIREYDLDNYYCEDMLKEFEGMDHGEILERIENEMRELEARRVKLLKLKERILKELIDSQELESF